MVERQVEQILRDTLAFAGEAVTTEVLGRVAALRPEPDAVVYAQQVADICRDVLPRVVATLKASLAEKDRQLARLEAIGKAMAAPDAGSVH